MFTKILHTFTSRVGIAGMNFLIVILTAQFLGAAGRGEISLFIANIAFLLLFTSILGGTSLTYLAPRTNIYQLLVPAYSWAILICAAGTSLLLLLGQVAPQFSVHLGILATLQAIFTINTTILIGKEKVKWYNSLTFLQTLLTLTVIAVGFYGFKAASVEYYVIALYVSFGLTCLLSFMAVFRLPDRVELSGIGKNLRYLFTLGATAQLSNILTFLNYRLDYYFLNTMNSAKAVGVYSVGVSISEAIWLVGGSLALVQYSRLVNTDDKAESERLTMQLVRLSFWATLLAVLVLAALPPAFYQFIFGKEFGSVNTIVWSLAIGIIAIGTGIMFSHYFGAHGRYAVNNWAAFIGLLFTVPACLVLIPRYGPVGAGLASSLSYLVANIFLFLKFRGETSFRLHHLLPRKTDMVYLKKLLPANKG